MEVIAKGLSFIFGFFAILVLVSESKILRDVSIRTFLIIIVNLEWLIVLNKKVSLYKKVSNSLNEARSKARIFIYFECLCRSTRKKCSQEARGIAPQLKKFARPCLPVK